MHKSFRLYGRKKVHLQALKPQPDKGSENSRIANKKHKCARPDDRSDGRRNSSSIGVTKAGFKKAKKHSNKLAWKII